MKRVMLLGAVAATIFLFSMLARTAGAPNMALLFAGVEGRSAGELMASLDRMSTPYEVRGDAIYVPAARRDAIRMALAGEGLPQQGQAGYELLDKLNGFATTSSMFDATYWRAKEGELARTILATPGVRAARVHIASQQQSAFSRSAPAPTGVVTVTTAGGALDGGQAQAIRFLVAAAVPGLAPEEVAVIDSARGVILTPGRKDPVMGELAGADGRATRLEQAMLDLLEARVGKGNVRVKVALDVDMERESVSERTFNPDGRVISGKETTEVSETTQGGNGGAVTAASNVPGGEAGGGGGQSTQRTETKETVRYDMSEVRREREKLPGAVRRMSIAVFVNEIAEEAGENGEPVLRSPEELAALRSLVADAAGMNEERGDRITIEAMPFRPIVNDGALVEADPLGDFMRHYLMDVVKFVVLSVVTLILGLFVVKPLLAAKGAPAPAIEAQQQAAPTATLAAAAPPAPEQDAIETLKTVALADTDQTAKLIQSWLETAEDAA